METFGKRLRAAREAAKITQGALAQRFDPPVSRTAVSRWEGDIDMPEPERLPVIGRAVRQSVDYLLTGHGKRGGSNTEPGPEIQGLVPMISWVQAGNWSDIFDNFPPGDAEEWLPSTKRVSRRAFALRVSGDSMNNPHGKPSFSEGDIIFIDPDVQPHHRSCVVVRLEHEEKATFKQLMIDGNHQYLKALNPGWPEPIIEVSKEATICGVVIGKWVD